MVKLNNQKAATIPETRSYGGGQAKSTVGIILFGLVTSAKLTKYGKGWLEKVKVLIFCALLSCQNSSWGG